MGRDRRVKKPRYVAIDRDRHGNERIYYRAPGKPKIRLRGPLLSAEFWDDYRAAQRGQLKPRAPEKRMADPVRGSFHALCVAYYKSAEYKRLSPRSRYVRKLLLDGICQQKDASGGALGEKSAARMERRHILKLRDAKAETPAAANGIVKALRQLYKFGMLYQLTDKNPAAEAPYLPSTNKEGYHQWTPEEIAKYEAHHPVGTMARLAFDLMVYTGQRRGDVVQWGPQHVRDGRLVFTQQKTGKRLAIPIHPALAASIGATKTGDLHYLQSSYGRPFKSSNSFGNRMRKWCDSAGLPECSAHGLRKVTASRLAEIGCAAHEIMAITGHDSLKEVERYTRGRDQTTLAESAMKKYVAGGYAKKSIPPNREVRYGEPIRQPNPLKQQEPLCRLVPQGRNRNPWLPR